MKRTILAALVPLAAMFSIVGLMVPAQALVPAATTVVSAQAADPQPPKVHTQIMGMADGSKVYKVDGKVVAAPTAVTASHTPWTGKSFNSQYVCVQNNIGTTWPIDTADNYFESGVKTLIFNDRFPAWGDASCISSGYVEGQILMIGTMQQSNTVCYIFNGTSVNGKYIDLSLAMNASSYSYSACRNTQQKLNNNISQGIGNAAGLANFISSTSWAGSIENGWYEDSYSFAGGDDRTSLCYLMKKC